MSRILQYKQISLWVILILTFIFLYGFRFISINFSFESFYPPEDSDYQYFLTFQKNFGESQDLMVSIALQSPKKDIFDSAFLTDADSIFERLRRTPYVDSVLSPTRAQAVKRSGVGLRRIPYFEFENQAELDSMRTHTQTIQELQGIYISEDNKFVCGHIFISRKISDSFERDELNAEIDRILSTYPYAKKVTGVPYIRSQYVKKIQQETLGFTGISLILIIIILGITFRNYYSTLLPVLTILLGTIWTFGSMAWLGYNLDMINCLLIPIIFVVGTSDVTHIITKYIAELKTGRPRQEAMEITLNEIGFATFLTCLTTAVGFVSLAITDVPPVVRFGLLGCFGIVVTYIISIALIPNILLMIPAEKIIHARSIESSPKWTPFLLRILTFTLKNTRKVMAFILLLVSVSLFFTSKIPMNMHLLEDVSYRDPIRESMVFFEKNFFGTRAFEMTLTMNPPYLATDKPVLDEMEKIQHFLEKQESYNLFISPISFLKAANYVQHFNREAYKRLPDTQEEITELIEYAYAKDEHHLLDKIISPDRKIARIGCRTADLGAYTHAAICDSLAGFIQKNIPSQYFTYRITGHGFLTEKNLEYLRTGLLQGLFMDFLAIGLLMGWLFGSWRMMLVSMIPNLIPLLVTAGIMGLFHITLTTTGAISFVVIFGIAVDDTIHFLTHYKLEIQKGIPLEEALQHTMVGTGKAMILTSIILLSGFCTLLSSSFGGTFSMGLFSMITIIFAVLSDLFLAPILIRYFAKHLHLSR